MAPRRQPSTKARSRPGDATPLTRENVAGLLPAALAAGLPEALHAALPARLDAYLDLLAGWNRAMNLTGGRDRADILCRLIPDSFELALFLESAPLAGSYPAAPRVLDLGAGGGLPGIPLRMVWDKGNYTLVEAREKRALFLANTLARLDLPRTTVFRGTAEEMFALEPHRADIILSRAFMPWRELLPFCRPGLAPGGLVIVFASEACGELPAPWRLRAQSSYDVQGQARWLWALTGGEDAHV